MLFQLIVTASALSEGHALFGENGRVFGHAVDKLQGVMNSQLQKRFEKETITELKALKENKEGRPSLLGSDVSDLVNVASLDLDAAKNQGMSILSSQKLQEYGNLKDTVNLAPSLMTNVLY